MPFKKPTVALREAKVWAHQKAGKPVPADTRRGYTDTMEFLSAGLCISYNAQHPPTAAQKTAVLEGAGRAREIIRKANDEFAAVVLLRRPESALFQQVLQTYFHLSTSAADLAGGQLKDNIVNKPFSFRALKEKDRRWVLNKIRENMLSVSFHLNTGMYLIDFDWSHRDILGGQPRVPAPSDIEGHVWGEKYDYDKATWRYTNMRYSDSLFCGMKHGEIHVSLENMVNYSANSYARVIIHEAIHKYPNIEDQAYAWDANFAGLSLAQTLDNADSYAWAAVSLYCGILKMDSPAKEPTDWRNS